MNEAADPLLTMPEVCEYLGVGLTTVKTLVARGDLGSLRIGTARRVPLSAVRRFVGERLIAERPRQVWNEAARPRGRFHAS